MSTRSVVVTSAPSGLLQSIMVGTHIVHADEPVEAGGADDGPNPYELLLGALGACTSMTLRLFANRKKWPLEHVTIRLEHSKVKVAPKGPSETEAVVDRIEKQIVLLGDLSHEQRERLLVIAVNCPVQRTLSASAEILTELAP